MRHRLRRIAERLALSRRDRRLLDIVRDELVGDTGVDTSDESGDATAWLGHAGIDLRAADQLALLRELEHSTYQALFDRLRSDARLSPDGQADGLVRNGYFPSPDAELYAAMIVRERPKRIVEIGSGFSTLVARHAIEHAGLECELAVIDPEPRIDVASVADRVERVRVEELAGFDASTLADGILFIDSTHRTRSGGDGPYLYCELLPSLPAGALVHVHDVYIPYDYPRVYRERLYTEQYLLHALLSGARRFQVVCAAYYMSRHHPEAIRAAFGPAVAAPNRFQGASFWFRSEATLDAPEDIYERDAAVAEHSRTERNT